MFAAERDDAADGRGNAPPVISSGGEPVYGGVVSRRASAGRHGPVAAHLSGSGSGGGAGAPPAVGADAGSGGRVVGKQSPVVDEPRLPDFYAPRVGEGQQLTVGRMFPSGERGSGCGSSEVHRGGGAFCAHSRSTRTLKSNA